MQRLRTVLPGRDQLVQEVAGVRVVAAAQVVQTWDLDPDPSHLLLQGHVQLRRKTRLGGGRVQNQA